eukprot:9522847-Ditylum_brightwellii.AAC.1
MECLTPHDIHRWMTYKVYGIDDLLPDNNPIEGSSINLKHYKKAISNYVSKCRMQWNEISR